MIQAAWRHLEEAGRGRKQGAEKSATQTAEYHVGVQLRAPQARVHIALTTYSPERPCFHHHGPFAFYVPSELEESTTRCTPLEERLLKSLRNLFDRVIAVDSPDSIEELRRCLLSRGSSLRLSIRTPDGVDRVEVHISDWKRRMRQHEGKNS